MPSNNHFRIIFKGEILPNIDKKVVKSRLAAVLKLNNDRLEQLFQNQESVLKDNLTEEAALRFQKTLQEKIGIITYIDELFNADSLLSLDGFSQPEQNNASSPKLETSSASTSPSSSSSTLKTSDTPSAATVFQDSVNITTSNNYDEMGSSSPSHNNSSSDESENKNKGKKRVLKLLFIPFIIIIGVVGYFGYNYFLQLRASEDSISATTPAIQHPIEEADNKATQAQINNINDVLEEDKNSAKMVSAEKNSSKKVIPECSAKEISELMGKLLIDGFPAYIEKDNPLITLQYNKTHLDNELYFDSQRNKRLCGLIAEYHATDNESLEENNIAFEIIYELYFDADEKLNISTFKHLLLGTIQNTDNKTSL